MVVVMQEEGHRLDHLVMHLHPSVVDTLEPHQQLYLHLYFHCMVLVVMGEEGHHWDHLVMHLHPSAVGMLQHPYPLYHPYLLYHPYPLQHHQQLHPLVMELIFHQLSLHGNLTCHYQGVLQHKNEDSGTHQSCHIKDRLTQDKSMPKQKDPL